MLVVPLDIEVWFLVSPITRFGCHCVVFFCWVHLLNSSSWLPDGAKGVKSESSSGSNQLLLPNIVNPNTRITPSLFNSNNYEDWAYLENMAIGGSKRLGLYHW